MDENQTTDSTENGSLVTSDLPEDTNTTQVDTTKEAVTAEPTKETSAENVTDKDPEKDASKPEAAPEKYEDFKLPDGMSVHEPTMQDFKTFAKEHQLSQKDAQALVDMQAKVYGEGLKQIQEQWTKTQAEWRDEVKADKDIGGDKFNATLSVAKNVVDVFGNDKFKRAVESTGMGNHPEFIRFLYNIGKEFADDDVLTTGENAKPAISPAKVLFPNMN